jgi:hypothetical protein
MNSDCCFVLATSHAPICLCCDGRSDTFCRVSRRSLRRQSLRPDWRRENLITCNQWWVSLCGVSFSQVPSPACPVMCDTVQTSSLASAS